MAKLTLAFKERKLKVFGLQSGDCVIGREPSCTIPIDSLAIERQHLRIRQVDQDFVVEPMSENIELIVNEQPVSGAHVLTEGDKIRIGKHTLRFSEASDASVPESNVVPLSNVGWLQIQNGSHLGRTIRLDKAFTRIGRREANLAVIAHRDDGYYLSHLQGDQTPKLNDEDIGDQTCKLNNNDEITIGELRVQFFADNSAAQDSKVAVTEQEDRQQRHFSRVPFDVPVTLRSEEQSWETNLIDISLHGALIRTPEAFEPEQDREYLLEIHLEGGPDISMDVLPAHHEDDELGLRCKDIDVDSITHLRRLVELNVGDPQLLERELSALG